MAAKVAKSVYIHVPFCLKKCLYCDFPVHALGRNSLANFSIVDRYIDALVKEINHELSKSSELLAPELRSVYFGGGTPSTLEPSAVARIFKQLQKYTNFTDKTEITMELDPKTFTADSLEKYHDIGVNRFSMGVQSLDLKEFSTLGRSHDLNEVLQSLDLLQKSPIDNMHISTDIMLGLPF